MFDSRILAISLVAGVVLLIIFAVATHKKKSSMDDAPKLSMVDQATHRAKTVLAELKSKF